MNRRQVLSGLSVGSLSFIFSFGVYLLGVASSIGVGDAAELSAAGATLGIAHSPGYPLYTLMARACTALIPWGHWAYRTNLFSALSMAGAVALGSAIVWSLAVGPRARVASVVFTVAALSLSSTLRSQAEGTEVFALNVFFVALLMWSVVRRSPLMFILFVFGLALGNHHTLLFLLPGLLVLHYAFAGARHPGAALSRPRFIKRLWQGAWPAALFFFLGLSVYFYLRVRSAQEPLLDWEDPETWGRFFDVVTRARYGTFSIAQGGRAALVWERMGALLVYWIDVLRANISALGILIFLGALLTGFVTRGRRWLTLGWFLVVFGMGPFFLFWANLPPTDTTRFILERFLGPSVFLVVILIALFSGQFLRTLHKSLSIVLPVLLTLSVLWLAATSTEASWLKARGMFVVRDHGRNTLRHLPERSVLIADRADETEFSLAYLWNAEGVRSDIQFVDANAGVSRSIYGKDYYKIWGKPRLQRRAQVEGAWMRQSDRAFYYATLDARQTGLPMSPRGVLFQAKGEEPVAVLPWHVFLLMRNVDVSSPRLRHLFWTTQDLLVQSALHVQRPAWAWESAKRWGRWQSDWRVHLGYRFLQAGEFAWAEKTYLSHLDDRPEEGEVWNNLGAVYARQGHWTKAIDAYRTALSGAPQYVEAHYNLGVAYWNLGAWVDVVESFETVLALQPDHGQAAKYLSEARRKLHAE